PARSRLHRPLSPVTTAAAWASSTTQTAITSAPSASSAGVSAGLAPAVTSTATASARTSVTVVGKPRSTRWRAIGPPMSPRPTKPTWSGSLTGAPRHRALAGVLDDELAPRQREGVGPGEDLLRVLVLDVLHDALVLTGEVPVLLPVVVEAEHEPVEDPPPVGAGVGRVVVEDPRRVGVDG